MNPFRAYERMQLKKKLQKRDKELQAQGYKANQALIPKKDLVKAQVPYRKPENSGM